MLGQSFAGMQTNIGEIMRNLCGYKGVEILEGHWMPDHVHRLVNIPPKIRVSNFMGYLKGKSSLMIFDRHATYQYVICVVPVPIYLVT